MSDVEVWPSVLSRLGPLVDDQRSNVKINLAMLASTIASIDSRALVGLAEIAVQAIREAVGDNHGAVRVLQVVIDERAALSPAARAEFDDKIARGMASSNFWGSAPPGLEGLLRLPSEALEFLPENLIADAVVNEARQLGSITHDSAQGARSSELRQRLLKLATTMQGFSANSWDVIKSAIFVRLGEVRADERNRTLFALMQTLPSFTQTTAEGGAGLQWTQGKAAARAGRPSVGKRVWKGVLGALIGSAYVTATMTLVQLSMDRDQVLPTLLVGVLVTGAFWLFTLPAALVFSLSYTPTTGTLYAQRSRVLAGLSGALLGICAISLSIVSYVLVAKSLGLDSTRDQALDFFAVNTGGTYWQVLAAATIVLTALGCAFVADRCRQVLHFASGKSHDKPAIVRLAVSVGPAIAAVTAICLVSLALKVTVVADAWPLVLAATVAIAFVILQVESLTWPSETQRYTESSSPPLVFAALIGAAIPLILSVVTGTSSLLRFSDSIRLNVPAGSDPAPRQVKVRSGRPIQLIPAQERLRADIETDPSDTVVLSRPRRLGADEDDIPLGMRSARAELAQRSGRSSDQIRVEPGRFQFRVVDNTRFCLVEKSAKRMQCTIEPEVPRIQGWLSQMLPMGDAPTISIAAVAGKQVGELSPPSVWVTLDKSPGTVDVKAGAVGGVHVLDEFMLMSVTASGTGLKSNSPARIVVIDPRSRRTIHSQTGGGQSALRVAKGDYWLCAHFGPADAAACDANGKDRVMFEDGMANVTVQAVAFDSSLSFPLPTGAGTIEVPAPIGYFVQLVAAAPTAVQIAVRDRGTSERGSGDLSLALHRSTSADYAGSPALARDDTGLPLIVTTRLVAGDYWLCVAREGSSCSVADKGTNVESWTKATIIVTGQ